jgi:hypothetical protein
LGRRFLNLKKRKEESVEYSLFPKIKTPEVERKF